MFMRIFLPFGISLLFFSTIESMTGDDGVLAACKSPIYCHGELLHAVQTSNLFNDPRHFIDMELKHTTQAILYKLSLLKKNPINPLNNENELSKFLQENFQEEKPLTCALQDFDKMEPTLNFIDDENYKTFYRTINQIWPQFAKKTTEGCKKEPDHHSMVHMPHCYMQVGESNSAPQYWQNYLIVRGLMANSMTKTAVGIMKNIAHFIEKHDFAIYSNRIYFSTRSQLPFLALMVEDYIDWMEEDDAFLDEILPAIKTEFEWWVKNRTVKVTKNGRQFDMFRYHQTICNPRPDHYKDDLDLAKLLPTPADQNTFYSNIYSLDESCFEFSSRFVRKRVPGEDKRLTVDIINIIPVELNSVLHRYATLISTWYVILKNQEMANEYTNKANNILNAITEVLYNSNKGAWFDWHLTENKLMEDYRPTNLMPLFTISYDYSHSSTVANNALNYLVSEGIINDSYDPNYFVIPTSNQRTGELWDFPNGSLLLNLFVIEGLQETTEPIAKKTAQKLAARLIQTVYEGFQKHGAVLENYSAIKRAEYGASSSHNQKLASAVGCVSILLKWYNEEVKSTDYQNFSPNFQTNTGDRSNYEDPEVKIKKQHL